MREPLRYSPYQFTCFRVVFGAYLCGHFLLLLPYGHELFSRSGMISDASLTPSYGVFPNVLTRLDSPLAVTLLLCALAVLAVLYALGIWRRGVALLLWYGWACLFNRNPLISNPSLPYVGWLLLASCAIPEGEPLSVRAWKPAREWRLPPALFWGAWALLMVGYSFSGVDKAMAPSWQDGSALLRVFEIPLARDTLLREALLALPFPVHAALTYGTLGLEILAAPLALWSRTRPWVWLGFVLMHLGILTVVDFADLTLAMLLPHLFVFDGRWLRSVPSKSDHVVVYFDGVCGLCNASVDMLVREDVDRRLRYAPLQGDTAVVRLGARAKALSYILVSDGDEVLDRSDALLRICAALGGFWRLAEVGRLVPRPVRDALYGVVAKNRYAWFGKREACRIPSPEERELFVS